VVDSATNEDVTAQTLAQVIYEAHKAGTATLSVEFLHEAIRKGGRALSEQVDRLQQNVLWQVYGVENLDFITGAAADFTLSTVMTYRF